MGPPQPARQQDDGLTDPAIVNLFQKSADRLAVLFWRTTVFAQMLGLVQNQVGVVPPLFLSAPEG